jgi:hypothetical protein
VYECKQQVDRLKASVAETRKVDTGSLADPSPMASSLSSSFNAIERELEQLGEMIVGNISVYRDARRKVAEQMAQRLDALDPVAT